MIGDSLDMKFKVIRVKQPIGEFFIASLKPQTLVDISYSDVRRLVKEDREVERYLGVQRQISQSRVKQIKRYVTSIDATFPTSVVLAVDERCAVYDEQNGCLTLKEFRSDDPLEESIALSRVAKVLDGQHRIAAFMDDNGNFLKLYEGEDFDINVSIFIGADISVQANIFATVNLAQTKVNKNLVYDLSSLSKTESPFKTCHNVAVMLDSEVSSPLYERIKRLGVATPGRNREPLTQAVFVESLVKFISVDPMQDRNDLLAGKKLKRVSDNELSATPFRNFFIDGNELDIAEIIYNYFSAVRKRWPESWNDYAKEGNLLPKSNAFKALMFFLKDGLYNRLARDNPIPSENDFLNLFEDIPLKDGDFNTTNFPPGSGGQSAFVKILKGQLLPKNSL